MEPRDAELLRGRDYPGEPDPPFSLDFFRCAAQHAIQVFQFAKIVNRKISEIFSGLLKSRGVKKVELARQLKVSPATVTGWSTGAIPSGGELYALAQYFGVSMEYILTGAESASNGSARLAAAEARAHKAEAELDKLKARLRSLTVD